MQPAPMPKDICCENFKGLLAYIRSHYGEDGVRQLTEGLVDGAYCVRDKFAPDQIVPMGLAQLTDPAYWVSNDFSLALLRNVKKLVAGPDPLYTAGYAMVRESLSRTTLFAARLAGPRRLAQRAARINARFNRTKDVHLAGATETSLTFELNYRSGFRITPDVCSWNLGIYSGIASLTGVAGVVGRETACVLDGAPHCCLEITWKKRRLIPRLFRGILAPIVRWSVRELIADYERTIEERTSLFDKLAASENKYRTLFEDSRQPMSLARDGRLVEVNPAWLALHGYGDKAEVLGRDVMDFIHPDDRRLLAARRESASSDPAGVVRMRDITAAGETIDVEVHSSRIEYGGQPSMLAMVKDVTALKKAEANRLQLEARLQRAEKMEAVAALAGGVAHDLNNILSGVVGYPDLLLMQLPEDSPLVEPLQAIQESGKKAAAIVEDLLTLARRGVSAREVVNLNAVIDRYIASPEYGRMISFHPGVAMDLQQDAELLNLSGSPVHLSKTLMNLVSNAAEAMPSGGRITIATANRHIAPQARGYEEMPAGDYCVLTVGDTGIGISEEDRDKIFEPFYTQKKMGRSGTGLGMAVVWGTVQDHAGFIRIQSAVGQGTIMRLFFPATRAPVAAAEDQRVDLDRFRGRGETVLVVDDVAEQRAVARRMLETLGYRVAVAASGEDALAYLEASPCDLVLLDMIMDPGIDGLETYRRIVDRRPGQKAIITTGFSQTDRVRKAQALGAGCYLQKPYTFEKLGQSVRSALDRPDQVS
ncbi:MAG: PAS domain S-box protein [Desulfobacterales bacterium]|nr:PAS domain S-box protein [Desulfobacterales bacterium]